MATRKIEKTDWKKYFDDESKQMETAKIRLELASADLGDQTEMDWLPVRGMSYDPREDRLDIMTDGLDHAIAHPKTIFAEEENGALRSLEVNDSQEQSHILNFRSSTAT